MAKHSPEDNENSELQQVPLQAAESALPGPTGHAWMNTINMVRDPAGESISLDEEYGEGGIYLIDKASGRSVVVTRPDLAEYVLANPEKFGITPFLKNDLGILLGAVEDFVSPDDSPPSMHGKNLFTTPVGEEWQRYRAHAQKMLSGERIGVVLSHLTDIVDRQIETFTEFIAALRQQAKIRRQNIVVS